jgi:hypothetical protein
MSLTDLASLGSFVSGFAVLISLIYLALQVRQAEKNQRAIIHQGRTAQTADRLFRGSEPARIKSNLKFLLGREPTTEELEFQQFMTMFSVSFREMQDVFFQHDIGLLDEAALNNNMGVLRGLLATPAGKAVWRIARPVYDPHFVERVDAIERSMPVEASFSPFERFKAELAKITAAY